MSHITAGETITDYLTHTGWDGNAIAGATFTVITARKPNGSSFSPTITSLGSGVYSVLTNPNDPLAQALLTEAT